MSLDRQTALASLIDKYSNGDGIHPTAIAELHCLKVSTPVKIPVVYSPSLCVIVQGAKQVMLEDEIYRYSPSEFLVVSVDLAVVGEVTEATAAKPYLCLQIDIDPRQMSDLITQIDPDVIGRSDTVRGLFVGKVDSALMDSILRLVKLLDTPKDIPLLAPMVIREIYYRLLDGDHGRQIAQIAVTGSNMQRIAQVLQMLKTDFAKQVRIEELAEMANMSPSSFHHHFKEVTAMSPLQYQKRLRLLEARRIMLSEEADASSAAYRVGYESPSQFSREYSRMFGAPPVRDVEILRHGAF